MLTFPAHSAVMGFKFLNYPGIPPAWRTDALLAWHGSWNRQNPEGFKVQRMKFQNGNPVGAEDFLTGFLNCKDGNCNRFGRPVGIVISSGGLFYISDDANGVIYCISKLDHTSSLYSFSDKKN